jgi:hypothetical protein
VCVADNPSATAISDAATAERMIREDKASAAFIINPLGTT